MLILQLHHYSKEDKSYYREKVQYLMSPLSASYNETLKVVLGLHCLQMDAMQWSLWRTNPLWHATAHRSPDPNPNCRPAAPNQIRPETCLFISRIIFLDYHHSTACYILQRNVLPKRVLESRVSSAQPCIYGYRMDQTDKTIAAGQFPLQASMSLAILAPPDEGVWQWQVAITCKVPGH